MSRTKRVGLKIENKGKYKYCYSMYDVNYELAYLVAHLKNNEAIEIKLGLEHRYIDYEPSGDYDWQITEVCKIAKLYLE